jgi:tetratricopeptide (TPR) repeat protein
VLGTIDSEGEGYRIEAALYRVGRDEPWLRRSAVAPAEEDVLRVLYDMTVDFRKTMGESPELIAMWAPPTTTSLAAFQLNMRGFTSSLDEKIGLYQRALEIDPKFLTPNIELTRAYLDLRNWHEARRYGQAAYRLSEDLPGADHLYVEIQYRESLHEYGRKVELLKQYRRLYPLEPWGSYQLGLTYLNAYRDSRKAEEPLRAAYRGFPGVLSDLSWCLANLGKVEEIERLAQDYKREGSSKVHEYYADRALLWASIGRADFRGALEIVERLEGERGQMRFAVASIEGMLGWWKTRLLLSSGRLRDALLAAGEVARELKPQRVVLELQRVSFLKTWIETRLGEGSQEISPDAIRWVENGLPNLPDLVILSLETGSAQPLERVISAHEQVEKDSKSQFVREELAFARGSLALIGGDSARALEILEPVTRTSAFQHRHHALARAYEKLGLWRDAAAEYERVFGSLDLSEGIFNGAILNLDRFRLARLYERLGNPDRARQWYERFLEDWKDADPDIPELVEAKKRFSDLNQS